jgi:tripartite-type tricarboxylate transporter receptor subunit TctC
VSQPSRTLPVLISFFAFAAACANAVAQHYPVRPVRIIAPFPPGGSTDIYARVVAKELSAALEQPVIIDNRPGGTGILGTQMARQAAPDGYTLLFTSNTAHVLGPLLKSPRPFDPVADFTAIGLTVRFPLYLVVNPSIPAKTTREFIAYAKARSGVLNYASSGEGGLSHLAALLFNAASGITATHIPYKGAAPAQQAVAAGEAQYRFDNVGTSQPLVLAGRLRGLALTGTARSPAAPEIPTLAEQGVKGLEGLHVWLGLLGPRALPTPIRDRLSGIVLGVLKTPEFTQRAAKDGYDIVAGSPAQFSANMRQEVAALERVINDNGIRE